MNEVGRGEKSEDPLIIGLWSAFPQLHVQKDFCTVLIIFVVADDGVVEFRRCTLECVLLST